LASDLHGGRFNLCFGPRSTLGCSGGPSPGEPGSAVLAAHISYEGQDGVFRRLADTQAGATITVGYADFREISYRIETVEQFAKSSLPTERIFARDREPVIALAKPI
jgi:hypothetical protein